MSVHAYLLTMLGIHGVSSTRAHRVSLLLFIPAAVHHVYKSLSQPSIQSITAVMDTHSDTSSKLTEVPDFAIQLTEPIFETLHSQPSNAASEPTDSATIIIDTAENLQETADSMSVATTPSSITDTPICDANMLTGY